MAKLPKKAQKQHCRMFDALMPAGWLQNYTDTRKTLNTFENQKCHTLQSKNVHKNIFNLKWTEKLEYSASVRKKQYSYKNEECRSKRKQNVWFHYEEGLKFVGNDIATSVLRCQQMF